MVLDGLSTSNIGLTDVVIKTVANLLSVIRKDASLTIGLPVRGLHTTSEEWLLKFLSVVHVRDQVAASLGIHCPFGSILLMSEAVLEQTRIRLHIVNDLLLHSSGSVGAVRLLRLL